MVSMRVTPLGTLKMLMILKKVTKINMKLLIMLIMMLMVLLLVLMVLLLSAVVLLLVLIAKLRAVVLPQCCLHSTQRPSGVEDCA
jgi:hypothetical protein